jgi:hypothetical protein
VKKIPQLVGLGTWSFLSVGIDYGVVDYENEPAT